MHRSVHLHIKMLYFFFFSESETRHLSFTSSRADKRQRDHTPGKQTGLTFRWITPRLNYKYLRYKLTYITYTVLSTDTRHTRSQKRVNVSMATHPIQVLRHKCAFIHIQKSTCIQNEYL